MAGAEDHALRRRALGKRLNRAITVLVFGGLSWFFTAAWHNAETKGRAVERAAIEANADLRDVENARTALNAGQIEEARAQLEQLSRRHLAPDLQSRVQLLRGKASWALGDGDAAAARFEGMLRQSPSGPDAGKARHKLGWLEWTSGDRAMAVDYWKTIGGSTDTLWPEGRALAAWAQEKPMEPGFAEPWGDTTRHFKTALQQLRDRNPIGRISLREIVALGPTNRRGDSKPSKDKQRKAAFFLGKAELGTGDVAEARARWMELAKAQPTGEWGPRAQFKVAVTSLLMGEAEQARAEFAAVKSGPLLPDAIAIERWLKSEPDLPPPLR